MWVPTFAFLLACMNDLTGYDPSSGMRGVLNTLYCGLGIAPTPAPANTLLMSDITEATYTGYARQAVVWFPTYLDILGPQAIQAATLEFRPTDAVVPNTITTIFLASALTAGTLYLTAALNPQISLSSSLYAAYAELAFQLPFSQIYGRPSVTA